MIEEMKLDPKIPQKKLDIDDIDFEPVALKKNSSISINKPINANIIVSNN